jgi:hypothetical protein
MAAVNSGLAVFVIPSRRVKQRRQFRFLGSEQLHDLPSSLFVLLGEQLPAEVLYVHLRDIYTLVHGDIASASLDKKS